MSQYILLKRIYRAIQQSGKKGVTFNLGGVPTTERMEFLIHINRDKIKDAINTLLQFRLIKNISKVSGTGRFVSQDSVVQPDLIEGKPHPRMIKRGAF